jgi:hypothetical protein
MSIKKQAGRRLPALQVSEKLPTVPLVHSSLSNVSAPEI